ncbi:MAG TPA: amino acid permease [Bacteroidales bacterium]|nr:amino acid permease [Bacteroidales bacterium]HPJ59753.1 amino acid permease [Bacteroidales bacterium]HPR11793.1 amino acid permease [Bacteroidales bacterium]HRW84058.1 amino acid permease [Bacteroidales bacterium]
MAEENLQRRLGLFPSTNIVVANMIGAGIFTTSGLLMTGLNSPLLMVVLWVAGGLIALCGALSYGELGAAMPGAGGEYLFLSRIFNPIFGFLSGWVSFIVGFSAPIAASAMGFSEYLCRAWPGLSDWLSSAGIMSEIWTKKVISLSVIIIFTIIHYRGIKTGARVQNVLTVLKVLLIMVLLIAGFSSPEGSFTNFSRDSISQTGFAGWKTIGLSLMWIMFAYSGWNASTYLGAEIRNPKKTLPLSLIYGTGIVIFLYVAMNILYVYAISPGQMKNVISVGGLAMGNLFGKPAEVLFSLLIGFALFSSLSAFIIIGPRVYYSMAKDGLFFKSVARIHPRFGVPSNSILLQCLIACILALSGSFEQILTYMGFALGIFPVLTVAGLFIMRSSGLSVVKIPGYPVTQLIYIAAGLMILILSFLERPGESAIALATVAIGIPAYFIFKRNLHKRN